MKDQGNVIVWRARSWAAASVSLGLLASCGAQDRGEGDAPFAGDGVHDAASPTDDTGTNTSVSESGNTRGWKPLGDTMAPGVVWRVIPLSSGGYAVLANEEATGKRKVYRWNGSSGAQASWSEYPPLAHAGEASDIAEFDGRLYATGPFTWFFGQSFPIEGSVLEIGVLSDLKRIAVSIDFDDPQAKWTALAVVASTSCQDLPGGGSVCDDLIPSVPVFMHVVPEGPVRGLYVLGGGLSATSGGIGFGGTAGATVVRLRPTSSGLADGLAGGLGNIPIPSPGGTAAFAVAHGAMPLSPGEPPTPVLVVGGRVHVDDAGDAVENGYGLGAWDGTSWHPIATGIERFPDTVCMGGLCGLNVQQSVRGLAFIGTDLYVSGEFQTVPLDPDRMYDTDADWLEPCETPGKICQGLRGFARVRNGSWDVLKDARFALPGLAFAGLGSPMGKKLVATNEGVVLLGGPWIPGLAPGAPSNAPLVAAPYGTHPDKNGVLRWTNGGWDTLQGGTHCYQAEPCSGTVHDATVVPGHPSLLVAGDFSAVGRHEISSFESQKLAIFTPSDECPYDLNNDGAVDGGDLGALLAGWNDTDGSNADLDDNGTVDGSDLGAILAGWGQCAEPIAPCGDDVLDTRDGEFYPTVLVGQQCWMAANLDHGVQVNAMGGGAALANDGVIQKLCYANNAQNCAMHGALYEWSEALQYAPSDPLSTGRTKGVCPDAWHLPTELEVQRLEHALGMSANVVVTEGFRGAPIGTKLKVGGASNFDMKLAGRRLGANTGAYEKLNTLGGFWTATTKTPTTSWVRLFDASEKVGRSSEAFSQAYSVRCVRD